MRCSGQGFGGIRVSWEVARRKEEEGAAVVVLDGEERTEEGRGAC